MREGRETVFRAYATPKDKIAVTKRCAVAWQASAHMNEETWADIANGNEWWQPTYALFVADTWEELRTQLDAEIVAKLQGKACPSRSNTSTSRPRHSTNRPRES